MRTYICLLVAGAALTPAIAAAQRPPARPAARSAPAAPQPKNEFGVDIGLSWVSPDQGDSRIRVGTPIDLRIGFVSKGRLMWEPRLSFAFDSEGLGLGDAAYSFSPQIVALYSMSPQKHRAGMYLFGGAGLNLVSIGAPTVDGGTTFSLGGGVGTRKRIGNAALRFEGGLRYDTEDSDAGMPSQFAVGGRVGLSFWH